MTWMRVILAIFWILLEGQAGLFILPPYLCYSGSLIQVLTLFSTYPHGPSHPSGGFKFCTVTFDISNSLKITRYQAKASAVVQELKSNWTCVVVAMTNHTNNNNGDLFIGYKGKKKAYVLACVLEILLLPWQSVIDGAEESYLWLFACSALINKPIAFGCLQQAVINHCMTATIGFNAVCFQPSFATHLLLAFMELVIIKCLSIRVAFPKMVGQSYKLG
ncbi:uncharacterized protein BJ212DRAFT_1487371 [Suillus subaureus]|uniref:Uncharacterized protein n=1 Tax=Suillus subaureus TaxID=48587 RepID=A0A9P7DT56_9AGAM|nr:uncharacterized protein BJ212DRAFT_1487371 [Suillus subaureus]KAG1802413.1 hypothetical protein BJ212DRAFT_1487371 [Suillus subaureus]